MKRDCPRMLVFFNFCHCRVKNREAFRSETSVKQYNMTDISFLNIMKGFMKIMQDQTDLQENEFKTR